MPTRRLSRFLYPIASALLLLFAGAGPVSSQPPFVVETIDPGGFVGSNISLAVDDQGRPHVVYWDITNFWLVYATRSDGSWTNEIIEAAVYLGVETSIAVDGQGIPHVSFHEYTASTDKLRYAVRSGGSWTVEDVDASGDDVGRYNAIAVDAQGRPHIAYHDETNGDLKYAVKDGGWSTETVDTPLGIGLYNDMVLDASGRPHIVYLDDEPDLFYAHKIGSTWYKETASGVTDAAPTGIDVDADGTPTIIHVYGGSLEILTRNGVNWQSAPIAGGASFDGAFVLDASNRAQIIYRRTASGINDLWHAEEADTGWVLEPIVETGTNGDVGLYADLALDPQGNLVCAYYDATNGDAMLIDSGVRLTTALSGVTWPVGSERTVSWRGAGTVDLELSTDGGASYQPLATGLTGGDGAGEGTHTFTVPHAPSRFCKLKVERAAPFSSSVSESLFTVEASVSLLNFVFTVPADGDGIVLSWATDPGPEDLAGYRIDRARGEVWSALVPFTTATSYHDTEGRVGDRYRLFAVNGLGETVLLGTDEPASPPTASALAVYPNPFGSGELSVSFATAGGLGGGNARATVAVYDVAGRLVAKLVDRAFAAGMQQATWDGRDAAGALVPSGIYFVRASSGGTVTTRKLTIVR